MQRSWKAEGLVEKVWDRLGVSNGRDELARLTRIHGTNLSSINSGKKLMSISYAERIAREVPGVTIYDLGAPVDVYAPSEQPPTVLERIADLEARVTRLEGGSTNADELRESVAKLRQAQDKQARKPPTRQRREEPPPSESAAR